MKFSKIQLNHFLENGLLYTGIKTQSSTLYKKYLNEFLKRQNSYKEKFLQKNINYAFDGYSYKGQKDSTNQYPEDQVFTYVWSDFSDNKPHAKEILKLRSTYKKDIELISKIEYALLRDINQTILEFYQKNIGHTLSFNFYPSCTLKHTTARLSEHPDISLITIFPFGIDQEFVYQTKDKQWKVLNSTDEIICFSGYLLEQLTGIKALKHKVDGHKYHYKKRYSFAFFSVPTPESIFTLKNKKISGKMYYDQYLSLF